MWQPEAYSRGEKNLILPDGQEGLMWGDTWDKVSVPPAGLHLLLSTRQQLGTLYQLAACTATTAVSGGEIFPGSAACSSLSSPQLPPSTPMFLSPLRAQHTAACPLPPAPG